MKKEFQTNNGFTKEFISQIENLKNSYLLSFALVDLLNHQDVLTILEKDNFKTENYTFNFEQISKLVNSSKENFSRLVWEYLMFSTRSLLISLYESFKEDETRYKKVKELDWFIFLCNLRNAIAHGIDAVWEYQSYGKQEVFYMRSYDNKKIVIDPNWNNSSMNFKQIGGWPTIIDILTFIRSEINLFLIKL